LKLGGIEKWFMNRSHHAEQTIKRAERLLYFVKLEGKQDFLEVGCGSGAVSNYIAKKFSLNVTGTDIDPDQIRLAEQNSGNLPNARFLEADATNLPFQDNDFDVVLSFGVMHHISNWLDALTEISRVLRTGGYFVYWDLVYPKWTAKIARLFQYKYGATTIQDLNSFIVNNNFSTIHSSLSKLIIFDHYEAVYQKN
jgi:ubiquinone/menaquinone biosynthesis C-methylase UbiE